MAIARERGEELITEFCAQYPSAYSLSYRVRNTLGELYGTRANEVPETFKAGYIPATSPLHRGRVDVATANASDERDLLRSIRHEVFGHHGLNTFAPEEKRAVLTAIIDARSDSEMAETWDKVAEWYAGSSDFLIAEEVYSLVAEDIDPHQPLNASDGERAIRETCIEQSRSIRMDDLEAITHFVAHGMATGERQQQNFPETPQSLFRNDSPMSEANAAPAGERSGEQDDAILNVGKATRKALALPPHMAKAFYPVGGRYYHQSNTTEHYFEVSANKLTASRTQPTEKMATMLVDVAAHNKWKSIEVTGTQGFRRETWHRASLAGIEVSGYEPDEHDLARLARARAAEQAPSNAPAPAAEPENTIRNATADTTELAQGSGGKNAAERGPVASTERRERMASIAAMAGAATAPEAGEGDKPDQQAASIKRERVLRTNTERARAELSQSDRNDLDAAVAFEEMKPSVATKSHPRLAGPYAVMGAYRASLKEQGVPEKERRAAEATMRDRLAERIRQGHYDAIKTEQVRFPGRETTERESRVQTQELTPSL